MTAKRPTSQIFLATTAIEDHWDKSARIVFLGEGCRRYSRSVEWAALDVEVLPDLWDIPQQRDDAYRHVNQVYEILLPRLGARLNGIHGETHGDRYWRVVLGHWLYHYLTVQYDRYSHLKLALQTYPELKTVLLSEACEFTPKDTLEFIRRTIDDPYNFQLCSRILDFLCRSEFPRVSLSQDASVIHEMKKGKPARKFYSVIRKLLTWLLTRVGNGRVILHKSYFSRGLELRIAIRSKGKVLPSFFLDEGLGRMQNDFKMRAGLDDLIAPQSEFESLLVSLLPKDIPQCFVEGYTDIADFTRNFPSSPRAIFSANSWYSDEVFKQWAGRSAEVGANLLVAQHGGGYYGLGTYFPSEDFDRSIADRYYTWGWRTGFVDSKRIVSLGAPSLSDRRHACPNNRSSGILFVATAIPRYLLNLQNPVGYFVRYLEWQKRFLSALPSSCKDALRARLYEEEFGWDIRDRWHDNEPTIPIESTMRPFMKSLEDCRLSVYDHLGTTFHEALAANRPAIIFFDSKRNPLRTEASNCLDELRRNAILFDDPESAANQVAIAYEDIEGWWAAPSRQAARMSFCAMFARTVANPVVNWTATLIANES